MYIMRRQLLSITFSCGFNNFQACKYIPLGRGGRQSLPSGPTEFQGVSLRALDDFVRVHSEFRIVPLLQVVTYYVTVGILAPAHLQRT